jgi:hypothetical protein
MKTMSDEEIIAIAKEVNCKYPGFLREGADDLAAVVSLKAPLSRRQRELGFLAALSGEWRLRNLDPALAGTAGAGAAEEGNIFNVSDGPDRANPV